MDAPPEQALVVVEPSPNLCDNYYRQPEVERLTFAAKLTKPGDTV